MDPRAHALTAVIRDVRPEDIDDVRAMLVDYQRALGVDLGFQGFDEELASLPGDYTPAVGGALLVADGNGLSGCVALRRWTHDACEMKRLYVAPPARGTGLGRRLAVAIVGRGRELGYRTMLLDTLPTMQAAIALYRSLGFVHTAPYRANPVPGTTYLALEL